jgi:hypothetical protein
MKGTSKPQAFSRGYYANRTEDENGLENGGISRTNFTSADGAPDVYSSAYPALHLFPGPRSGTHHQLYYAYATYVMHVVLPGLIFPVLPQGSLYDAVTTEPPVPTPSASLHSPLFIRCARN